MQNPILSYVKRAISLLLLGALFLTPLAFWPMSTNVIGHAKNLIFLITFVLLGVGFTAVTILKKRWELVLSPLTVSLIVFGLAMAGSTFFTNPYPVEALLNEGGWFMAGVVIVILGGTLMTKKMASKFIDVLGVSGAALSVTTLLQLVGWGPSRILSSFFGYELAHDLTFNIAGSSLTALQVLVVAMIGVIAQVVIKKKLSTLHAIIIPAILMGIGINAWAILPGKATSVVLPPLAASYTIILDSLRTPQTALIGSGPASYSNVFAQFKPNWVNGQNYWQFNFASASSLPLTLIVTTGVIGVTAWLAVVVSFFRQTKIARNKQLALTWVVLATFVFQLILPNNATLLLVQVLALAAWVAAKKKHLPTLQFKAMTIQTSPEHIDAIGVRKSKHQGLVAIGASLFGVIFLLTGYLGTRAYASFYQMYQADKSLAENDVVASYDHQRQAVALNPYLDLNRRRYALTNLQIAIALSNNTEITEEERTQVTDLVSQAIRESRASTTLDPRDFQNWAVVGEVYKRLIGTAQEADQWAVNSYVSAVENNPSNPLLRIELGSLFFDKEQYQDAAGFFNQAVQLKPDLPAGYFQLGRALVQLEQYVQANQAWEQAMLLLDPESEDYIAVQTEIDKIADKVKEQQAAIAKAQAEAAAKQQQAAQQQQQGQGQAQGQGQNQTGGGLQELTQPMEDKPEPSIAPITEQNVQQSGSKTVSQPADEPLDVSPQTEESLNQATDL